jgi:biopolymer transport protein ExbD
MIRGKFTRKSFREVPPISTASLPDIVFMLLFFFMVATHLRQTTKLVNYALPNATEISKLQGPKGISYIFIGPPADSVRFGNAARIQLNDQFAEPEDIAQFVAAETAELTTEEKEKHIYSLKIDSRTPMQLVNEVKHELRKANALRVNFSVVEGSGN